LALDLRDLIASLARAADMDGTNGGGVEFDMSKNSILLCATVVVICGLFIMWTAAGRPPYGPFNNMGFDGTWDCPPNATASSTVCIKKLPPVGTHPQSSSFPETEVRSGPIVTGPTR
jgi:hypothetical protein